MALPSQLEADPWPALRAELRRSVGHTVYEIWLAGLGPLGWDGSVLELAAPGETCAWVRRRYGRMLEDCASRLLGRAIRVTLTQADPDAPAGARTVSREPPAGHNIPPVGKPSNHPRHSGHDRSLNPRYRFDQFIIGEGNRLAHSAALTVAEIPGQAYNPLFLYAPPGLGKTHLLQAIGNYILEFGGNARVRYTTVEAFTNHFLHALTSRTVETFKQEYRDADVLLIDDVQFLVSKARTEEEFFHTFDALYETGRQLVLTCDRLPAELVGVEKRLRERFEAGLVAEISPPDLATRIAILRKRAALDHLTVDDETVFTVIGERVNDNIRALEGALIRVVAFASLTGQPMTAALARRVLGASPCEELPAAQGATDIATIREAVAEHFAVTVAEIVSPARAARIVWPRQVAIHLARELTHTSLPSVGSAFGGRNHATIIHACRRVQERLGNDPQARADVEALRRTLTRARGFRQQVDRRD